MTNDIPLTHPYRNSAWEHDIYPMPSFPMISVADVDAVSQWYQALGFVDVFTMRDGDQKAMLAHLRWCRYADILISRARVAIEGPRGRGIVINFMTLRPDDVADRARALGTVILEGPINRPWNARDVLIADPEGHRLNFTGPAPRDDAREASFEDVIERVRKL
jgi:hypothetical protein